MKFRKKPVVIEAVQFRGENYLDVVTFCDGVTITLCNHNFGDPYTACRIPTLEGEMTASIGDWIIRGVNGEYYPCKPDIFEKTYELAE